MQWWFWFIIGLGLLVLEVVMPTGFFLLMFGVAAIAVGILVSVGLAGGWEAQGIVFSVLAVLFAIILAKRMKGTTASNNMEPTGAVGAKIRVVADTVVGAVGQGELWGSPWRVKNVGVDTILAGEECLVIGVEGVTLQVKRTS